MCRRCTAFPITRDGTVNSIRALEGAPEIVEKRIVKDFSGSYFPSRFIVPSTEVVHDRVMLELFAAA
jgi:hypothetical protein